MTLLTVVRALRFDENRRREELRTIPEAQWPALLRLTDEAQLTLPLGIRPGLMIANGLLIWSTAGQLPAFKLVLPGGVAKPQP